MNRIAASLASKLLAALFALGAGAASAQNATPTAPAATATPTQAAKPADETIPEDCVKLVGAITACRQAGGWKQPICEKGAKMQFDKCPIPVEKLPIKL
jgi:hypothetical protein